VAAIVISPSVIKLGYAVHLHFTIETNKSINNIAEYEATLLGLHKLRAMGVHNCILKTNSTVIVSRIEKECMARDATVERYLVIIRRMENNLKRFPVKYVERTKNIEADELAKVAARKTLLQLDVCFSKPSRTPP
jgi:ribonuclease HI